MLRSLIVMALLLTSTGPAVAQNRCTKGIPCGNSFISATKPGPNRAPPPAT